MLTRSLFTKYQKYLVSFANSQIGRLYLKSVGEVLDLPIVKVTPDSIHYLDGFQDTDCKIPRLRAVFYSRSPYLKKFSLSLTTIESASKYSDFLGWINKPELTQLVIPHFQGLNPTRALPSVMLATDTFYPNANTETTSVDGWAGRYNTSPSEAWATMRGGAGNQSSDTAGSYADSPIVSCWTTSNTFNNIARAFFLFDTSSLGAGATVSAAIFSVYGANKYAGIGSSAQQELSLVGSTPASNTAIVDADYSQIGATKYADDLAYASFNTSGYNDFNLNASGLAAINPADVSKFGMRMGADADNSAPTWSSGQWMEYGLHYADYTGTTRDPKLVVTYTPAPSLGSPIFLRGGLTLG